VSARLGPVSGSQKPIATRTCAPPGTGSSESRTPLSLAGRQASVGGRAVPIPPPRLTSQAWCLRPGQAGGCPMPRGPRRADRDPCRKPSHGGEGWRGAKTLTRGSPSVESEFNALSISCLSGDPDVECLHILQKILRPCEPDGVHCGNDDRDAGRGPGRRRCIDACGASDDDPRRGSSARGSRICRPPYLQRNASAAPRAANSLQRDG
jgi:hypothetical protein